MTRMNLGPVVQRTLAVLFISLLVWSIPSAVPARADSNVVYVGLGETGIGGSCDAPDFGVASYDDSSSDAIQAALDEADVEAAIDTVHICDGHTLTDTLNINRHNDVTIEGDSDATVLNGNHDVRLIYACERVDARYTIRNITLTRGDTDGWGGAISYQGTLILDNVEVSENTAGEGGGAIDNCDNGNDALEIYDSTFAANTSDGVGGLGGGAILNWGGSVIVERSTFWGNSIDGVGNVGGAIYANLIVVRDSEFESNRAGDDGGAIFATTDVGDGTLDAGSIEVTASRFIDNEADDDGGAMSAEGPITIRGSRFTENVAGDDGGAVDANGGLLVTSSTFNGNLIEAEGNGDGGAIWAAGPVSITGSLFSENVAESEVSGEGGAVNIEEACDGFLLQSSTFTGNYAGWSGGALNFNHCLVSDTLRITASRFIQNSAGYATGGAVDVDIDDDSGEGGVLIVTGSRFQANRAAADADLLGDPEDGVGGAIWTGHGRILRNTFLSNTAPSCGGAVNIRHSRFEARQAERGNVFRHNRSAGRRTTWNVCLGW